MIQLPVVPENGNSLMTTECSGKLFGFHPLSTQEVHGGFDRGAITSDGCGLLPREVEKRTGIVERLRSSANCLTIDLHAEPRPLVNEGAAVLDSQFRAHSPRVIKRADDVMAHGLRQVGNNYGDMQHGR